MHRRTSSGRNKKYIIIGYCWRAFDAVLPDGIRLDTICLILSGKDIVDAVLLLFTLLDQTINQLCVVLIEDTDVSQGETLKRVLLDRPER